MAAVSRAVPKVFGLGEAGPAGMDLPVGTPVRAEVRDKGTSGESYNPEPPGTCAH